MSFGSVLITGANRGLGLEFVKQLISSSKPPSHVFAACRNPDKANDLQEIAKSHGNVNILKLDVKDCKSYPAVVQQVGNVVGDAGLNLLINNAGIMFRDSLETVAKENMVETFEVNVVAPLLFTKEVLPLLRKAAKSGGNTLSCSRAGVVNITSKMGSMDDNTSGSAYSYRTSKTALNMVTKSLSVDLKPEGILAFALHPGWVLTDMGGPQALITTEVSVEGMLGTISKATAEQAGLMLNYDGKRIPW